MQRDMHTREQPGHLEQKDEMKYSWEVGRQTGYDEPHQIQVLSTVQHTAVSITTWQQHDCLHSSHESMPFGLFRSGLLLSLAPEKTL